MKSVLGPPVGSIGAAGPLHWKGTGWMELSPRQWIVTSSPGHDASAVTARIVPAKASSHSQFAQAHAELWLRDTPLAGRYVATALCRGKLASFGKSQ